MGNRLLLYVWRRAERISLIVVSLPFGTFLINWSTSIGAGITTVPVPNFLLILPLISSTFGYPLLSFSFYFHVGLFAGIF
jgi:hypothetical protein